MIIESGDMMKKSIIYTVVVVFVIALTVSIILIINNNKLSSNKDKENVVPSNNEANKMTDEELIERITKGEQKLVLDTPESDNLLTNIDTVLNETNPLDEMPGE